MTANKKRKSRWNSTKYYFKSWRQPSLSRRNINLHRLNHFLPVGQLPNLKSIALHGSPITELIFFQSNCASSYPPTNLLLNRSTEEIYTKTKERTHPRRVPFDDCLDNCPLLHELSNSNFGRDASIIETIGLARIIRIFQGQCESRVKLRFRLMEFLTKGIKKD